MALRRTTFFFTKATMGAATALKNVCGVKGKNNVGGIYLLRLCPFISNTQTRDQLDRSAYIVVCVLIQVLSKYFRLMYASLLSPLLSPFLFSTSSILSLFLLPSYHHRQNVKYMFFFFIPDSGFPELTTLFNQLLLLRSRLSLTCVCKTHHLILSS